MRIKCNENHLGASTETNNLSKSNEVCLEQLLSLDRIVGTGFMFFLEIEARSNGRDKEF